VQLIRANIELCSVQDRVRVIHESVNHAIHRLTAQGGCFDLIFMDPPYGKGSVQKTLTNLTAVARSGALVVAEHDSKDLLSSSYQEWIRTQARKYGDTTVSFYVRELAC
jgi:16S rRNA (guanine966-N2)-methyltransferase